MKYFHLTYCHFLSGEMNVQFDVFGALMLDRIGRQVELSQKIRVARESG